MPRNYLDQLLSSSPSSSTERGRHRRLTLPISIAFHAVVLAAVVIVPLLTWDELPEPANGAVKAFFVEHAPPPPPPPPPPPAAPRAATTAPRVEAPKIDTPKPEFTAPIDVPKEIRPESGSGPATVGEVTGGDPEGVEGGVEGGVKGGVVGGVKGGVEGGVPEAPPSTEPEAPKPVRVGGQIRAPRKLRNVEPAYPEVAKQARVAGMVILEAVIGPDGKVDNVKVLRGIPLLNDAALNAVKQWVYSPTLLNGTPVPVIMTVTVNFTMS
jgi:periplasmic protein TonB